MKKTIAAVLATLILSFGSIAVAPNTAFAFTGHHCRISTCRFFTSSYYNARYYYDRRTCNQWKGLSLKYLQGFRRRAALLRHYPNRVLHPPC